MVCMVTVLVHENNSYGLGFLVLDPTQPQYGSFPVSHMGESDDAYHT